MPYDRDQVVSKLTELYELLVRMYLPDDALKRAPPQGWPSVTRSRFAFMNRSDTVLDLLRHLPYICQEIRQEPFQIYDYCICNDYTGGYLEHAVDRKDLFPTEPLPEVLAVSNVREGIGAIEVENDEFVLGPDALAIARPPNDMGIFVYINTRTGSVYLDDEHRTRRYDDIAQFVDTVTEQYRTLQVAPINSHEVCPVADKRYQSLREIYLAHGWPGQDCLSKVEEWWAQY